jgi:uncharacterized protein
MASQPPATTGNYVEPVPTWQVMLAGQDLTRLIAPLLISATVTQQRNEKADELTIEIIDDGTVALPPFNATLTVAMGWLRGTGVPVGLVQMGTFVVDDLTWEGPPDKITIKAHSADLKDTYRTRRTRTWTNQTLSAITAQIATENGLTNAIHPDLAGTVVDAADQNNQSDMEFIRDLGRRYDAIATVKAGRLIFAPIGTTTTASGATLPTLALTRQSVSTYTFNRNARTSNFNGAEANYYDQNGAIRALHQEGSTPRKRLKRVYGSAQSAQAAARAEHSRLKRAAARFTITLPLGIPQIAPNLEATATGFKTEIDATTWLTAKVDHTMTPTGLTSSIEMEVTGATDTTD